MEITHYTANDKYTELDPPASLRKTAPDIDIIWKQNTCVHYFCWIKYYRFSEFYARRIVRFWKNENESCDNGEKQVLTSALLTLIWKIDFPPTQTVDIFLWYFKACSFKVRVAKSSWESWHVAHAAWSNQTLKNIPIFSILVPTISTRFYGTNFGGSSIFLLY